MSTVDQAMESGIETHQKQNKERPCIFYMNKFKVTIFLLLWTPSIGSLGKGNSEAHVADVLVDRVFLHDTTNGFRIKTWQVQARTQI